MSLTWNTQEFSSPQGESSAEQGATLVSALEFESGLSASAGQRTQCENGAGKDHDGDTATLKSSVTDPAPEKIKEESMSVVDRLSKEENAVLDTNIVDGIVTLNLKDGTTHTFTISSPSGCGRGEVTVRQLKARLESIVTHYRTPMTSSTTDPFERVEVFLERSDSHGPQPEIIAQD